MNDINAKLLAAGFSQEEIDAPADCDTLLLGLVGYGVQYDDLKWIREHFADQRRFRLAMERTRLDGRLVWDRERELYVAKSP